MRRDILATALALCALSCARIREEPDTSAPDVPVDTGVELADTLPETAADTVADTALDSVVDTAWDPPVDTLPDPDAEPVADTGTDPGTGWGVPVCTTGRSIVDRGSYSGSITLPSLGTFYVMELAIEIDDRRVVGVEIPFDDLVVSLASPGGTERVFWKNFTSDDTGLVFPNYAFPDTWTLPVWWGTSVGGSWTLEIDDTKISLSPTNLARWCLTPIDPAVHASHVYSTTLDACATDTGAIPDCDMTTPDCPGDVTFEMQVDDLVKQVTGSPTLELRISHSSPSDLRIVFTEANGRVETLWDRSSGSLPSTFTLAGMAGDWATGRYQLLVEDHVEGTRGSVTSWCVRFN
jgi:subtilisin-like proprotein convertase family protein